jgi:chemotaxis protein CheD
MLHALLPTAPERKNNPGPVRGRSGGNPTKFVDQGTPLLIESLLKRGARRSRLRAHLCGGAQLLDALGFNDSLNIGERNVLAAEKALRAAGFRVQGRATGGNVGRTVRLYIANGQVTVRSLEQGERPISEPRSEDEETR